MKKKHLIAMLSLAILASGVSTHVQAARKIQVTVNNQVIKTNVSPYIEAGTVQVSLTLLKEFKGVQLSWDTLNKTVTVNTDQGQYKLKIGDIFATKGKEKYQLSTAAAIKQNHVMVPLRFIAEISGAAVSWDSAKQAVVIQSGTAENIANSGSTMTIQLDNVSYTIPILSEQLKKYSFAAKTTAGIVWSPAPERSESNDSSIYYPATPYTLYLSEPNVHNLDVKQSQKLLELSSGEKDAFQTLRDIHAVGDHVIYHTALIKKGMAQAIQSQAWIMKVTDPQNKKEIESFHSAGGYSYSFGIESQDGLYVSLSEIPNSNGGYNKKVFVYDISTDKKKSIDQYTFTDKHIQFEYDGKKYSVPIEQF